MPSLDTASLILSLTEKLRASRSWAGETHLQKAVYVLDRILSVSLPFEFILYKHGPFSFDLRDEIRWMRNSSFLEWEIKSDHYGPSLRGGRLGEALKSKFPELPKRYSTEIEFVSSRFGNKNVADLERLTTAIYVTVEEKADPNERANHIHYLKPHVSLPEAEAAVNEADILIRSARSRFALSATA
jgi:uncharacterized protein YwgA